MGTLATHPITYNGLLLVNKSAGMTSHDVVALVRRRLGLRRIGHAGTLDPMAEGLLVLLVGRATKVQAASQQHEKSYRAVIPFGTQTDTGDAMGQVRRTAQVPPLTERAVRGVLRDLVGPLSQTPPTYSAVKVQGRPSYWWARRGAAVSLKPRTVHLHALTFEHLTSDQLTVTVQCSAGTYVRSLGELLAERLGTVGHLCALTRLRIGDWRLDDAVSVPWLREQSPEQIASRLQPPPMLNAC